MTEPIKLPPEFRSGNSIPVERATITRERMVEILTEAVEPYIETLFKIGEHLGINYQAARTAPGKPSDVYIAAIDADRQTTNKQFAAYKRLTDSLESRIALLQKQYDELKKTTDPSLLESERAANVLLTEEVEVLKADREAKDTLYANQYLSLTDAMGYEPDSGLSPEEWASALRSDRQARGNADASTNSGEPVAMVCIEKDYWSRGHFYKGSRKEVKLLKAFYDLPVGAYLYAPQPKQQAVKQEACNECEGDGAGGRHEDDCEYAKLNLG